jgi:hypothetical protein
LFHGIVWIWLPLFGDGHATVVLIDETMHASRTSLQDGTVSAMAGACTVVRDVTDFCFHSYFSFMDDLIDKMGDNEEAPRDIKYEQLSLHILLSIYINFGHSWSSEER